MSREEYTTMAAWLEPTDLERWEAYNALRARVEKLEADADRREDRAYVSGARQAQAMAHQSLHALDQWINAGCGGRFGVGLSGNKGGSRDG